MLRTAEAIKTGRSKALGRKKPEKKELFPQPLLHSGHLQEARHHSAKPGRGCERGRESSSLGERLGRASSIQPAFP